MKKVYLVTSGCYSSYRVDGAFSSEAKAGEFMRLWPRSVYDGYNEIEELELDAGIVEGRKGCVMWRIAMGLDGSVKHLCRAHDTCGYEPTCLWVGNGYGGNFIGGCVLAKDERHAVKIANKRRAIVIASGELGR